MLYECSDDSIGVILVEDPGFTVPSTPIRTQWLPDWPGVVEVKSKSPRL